MTVTKTYYRREKATPYRREKATPYEGRRGLGRPHRRRRDERGEGVISAAIAVLIMAFIGVGMWVAFNSMFQQTAKNVDNQVNCIGKSSC